MHLPSSDISDHLIFVNKNKNLKTQIIHLIPHNNMRVFPFPHLIFHPKLNKSSGYKNRSSPQPSDTVDPDTGVRIPHELLVDQWEPLLNDLLGRCRSIGEGKLWHRHTYRHGLVKLGVQKTSYHFLLGRPFYRPGQWHKLGETPCAPSGAWCSSPLWHPAKKYSKVDSTGENKTSYWKL